MLRGLALAASGMMADERLQQLLSNNLANTETPGFKASDGEFLAFPEQLLEAVNYGNGTGPTIGKMTTGVLFQEGMPLFLQGQLSQSGRSLDVAIADSTPPGTYSWVLPGGQATSSPQTAYGAVVAGANGRLGVGGQPLAVIDGSGKVIPNVYAARNPAYQGTLLMGADGKPLADGKGNPSYVYVNASNQVIGQAGQPGWETAGIRVGTEADMGYHSFFAVAFQSPVGASGIALTRDGHLNVTNQDVVVDSSGNAILPVDQNGNPIPNGRIVLNPNYTGKDLFHADGTAVIDTTGQPSYRITDTNGNVLPQGRLGTVDADVTQLSPLGQSEFQIGASLNSAQVLPMLRKGSGSLNPGETEQSNVDPTTTMTQMLEVVAQYQANQQMIRSEDAELQKAVQDVGKVNA